MQARFHPKPIKFLILAATLLQVVTLASPSLSPARDRLQYAHAEKEGLETLEHFTWHKRMQLS